MVGDLPDDPQSTATVVRPGRKGRRKPRIEPVSTVGDFQHHPTVVPRFHMDRRPPMLAGVGQQLIQGERQIARSVAEAVGDGQVVDGPSHRGNVIRIATQDGGEVAIPSLG